MTIDRPEPERLEESARCSETGLIRFYTNEPNPPDYGPVPLRYDVRLELDGRRYRAEATAPEDVEERDGHTQVALAFDPPLPGFTG